MDKLTKLKYEVAAKALLLKEWFRPFLKPSTEKKISREQQERANFFSTFLKPGDLVFDVGANLGNRIAPLLQCEAKVVAIEPQYYCYRYLQMRFGRKITCLNVGLGSREYETEIMLNNASSTIASMSPEWIQNMGKTRFSSTLWNKKQKAQVTTLKKLIESYGIPVFVKIDVEGFETEVLKGLDQPIKLVSFEYTTPEMTEAALDCVQQLLRLSSDSVFNYAIAENTRFELRDWVKGDEIKKILTDRVQELGGFGDIYARIPA